MSLGQFFELVGSVLRLNPDTMRAIAQSPDGLRVALTILLLGSFSDATGNSPILFLSGIGGRRFVLCLLVDTLLSVLRIAIWILALVVLLNLLPQADVSLTDAALIVGIGCTPMLLSFLALLPLVGPVLLRLLHAWVFVTMFVALRAIFGLALGPALTIALVGCVAALVIGHTVDRHVVRGFGWLTRRLLGVDLLLRFDQVDLVDQVIAGGFVGEPVSGPPAETPPVRSQPAGTTEARP
jgi:hypothetical protein